MHDVWQDIRFAVRTLAAAPTFTILAIVTIALGLGANTAVFSMVNGVLLRRLPYGADDRLVALHQPSATTADASFSVPEVGDYRRQVPELEAVSEYHSMSFDLYGHGEPLHVVTGVVSDNFFNILGVRPLLGRTFTAGEDVVGAPPVVVLSYAFWVDKMGTDPQVIGSTFHMNDKVHTIVGVLPPLPPYPDANDIWMPAGACPFRSSPMMLNSRAMRMVRAFGVLAPGATIDRAARSVALVANRLHTQYPGDYPTTEALSTTTQPLRDELTQRSRPLFLTLLATALFVLIIAAANFAALTLSRQLRRGREMALRAALGASRGRLFRQLVTESLCITLPGGALGVLVAYSGLGMLRTMAERVTPRAADISIDPVVLGFALVLSVAVGVVASVAPLRRTRQSLALPLRAGALTTTGGREDLRARGILVTAQVAFAFVVLIAAGLLTRSLLALERVDVGYDVDRVMTAQVSLNWSVYTSPASRRTFADELLARLEGVPGATSVALSSDFPLNNAQPSSQPFQIRGQPMAAAGAVQPRSDVTVVSPDYFRTIGIPVLAGRGFTGTDRDTVSVPAIIGQRLARTWWRNGDALGSEISLDRGEHWLTVIGVVGDVRQNNLASDVSDEIYLPLAAVPTTNVLVSMRTRGEPVGMAARIRSLVHEIDPNQPVFGLRTLEELRGTSLAQPRETAVLVMGFAVLSLVITAGGLAGVVGYAVSQRRAEIGIRVALGATERDVLTAVMRGGVTVAVIGVVVGAVVSLALSRFIRGLLYAITPTDPVTFGLVGALLLAIAIIACLLPARRALGFEAMEAFQARG